MAEMNGDIELPDLGILDLTSEDYLLDEVDVHIQENLEHEIVKEALQKGVDLRQYSKQVEAELSEIEHSSVQDYIQESANIARLHRQVTSCDKVLESMEQMLNGFQDALSSISGQIQSLQSQSISMNQRLKNRQAVRGNLSQFLDEMVIPESLINHILETPVTEREFLEQLHELHHKMEFVKQQSFHETRSCLDVNDILNKLKIKAIEKIREYVLSKIYQFKKPFTNYEIPQNALLKFRFYNEFLMAHDRTIAKEIRDEYIDTTSKMYMSYFKSYTSKLVKLQFEEVAEKDDLMGADYTNKKSLFSTKPLKQKETVFTFGSRGNVLNELETPVIVPHASQKNMQRYSHENLFRSEHYALVENSCREYLFLCDFFMVSGQAAQTTFNAVLGKTIAMMLKLIETQVTESFDCISMFLCIHIVHRYRILCQTRGCPALGDYWDLLLQLLQPRFEHVFRLNVQSLRDVDVAKLGQLDTRPHYITRRFAEFASAIISLNQSFPSPRVDAIMSEMRAEAQSMLGRMASVVGANNALILLINNEDLVLSVFAERGIEDCPESAAFREALNQHASQYVERLLRAQQGSLIQFVTQAETAVERGNLEQCGQQLAERVGPLVRNFNDTWKRSIETINQEVMKSFVNFKNGTGIVQAALTQLIQYYHRFQKVLSLAPFKSLPVRNELTNLHHIMVEVKKHKPVF